MLVGNAHNIAETKGKGLKRLLAKTDYQIGVSIFLMHCIVFNTAHNSKSIKKFLPKSGYYMGLVRTKFVPKLNPQYYKSCVLPLSRDA